MATSQHARIETLETRRLLSTDSFGSANGLGDLSDTILAEWRQPAIFRLHGPAINAFPDGTLHSPQALFERTLPLDQYTVTIDWGDGSTSAGELVRIGDKGALVNGTHEYAQPGQYRLTLVVEASDGYHDSFSQTVIPFAEPLALVHDILSSYWREEGMWAGFLAVVEPVAVENADAIVASIDWGDGTITTARRGSNWHDDGEKFNGEHLYTEPGTYTVTFTAAGYDRNDVLQTLVVTRELTVGATPAEDNDIVLVGQRVAPGEPMHALGSFEEVGWLTAPPHRGASIASDLFSDGETVGEIL